MFRSQIMRIADVIALIGRDALGTTDVTVAGASQFIVKGEER